MSIQKINTRAKSIRRAHPGMAWNAAQKKAAQQLRGTGGSTKKRTSHAAPVHRKKKRASVGSTTTTKTTTRRKKKSGFLGATGQTQSRLIAIGEIALGMAIGTAGTHAILRPIEHKVLEKFKHPYVAKAMPWAEIILGGGMFLLGKWKLLRNTGLGVMGCGVSSASKQLPFHMHSPSETINGVGDFVQTRIPMNGGLRETISGLIQSDKGYTKTPTVGDSVLYNDSGPVRTPTVGAHYRTLDRTPQVGGDYEEEDENLFRRNHYAR